MWTFGNKEQISTADGKYVGWRVRGVVDVEDRQIGIMKDCVSQSFFFYSEDNWSIKEFPQEKWYVQFHFSNNMQVNSGDGRENSERVKLQEFNASPSLIWTMKIIVETRLWGIFQRDLENQS